jgi:hypothetical protein
MSLLTRRNLVAAFGALALVAFASTSSMAQDQRVKLTATLTGADEVPAHKVPGKGKASLVLNQRSKVLHWNILYNGLTGDATGVHFHGPAAPGANAGVALPIMAGPSPIKGKATLSDAQIADLMAGKWYVNIHTVANPGGEIRGQVLPAPPK